MFHPNQFVSVVAAALGFGEDGGAVAVGKLRRAGENPKVGVGTAADEHVAVVGIEQHDAIVRVERAEEGYTEQGWSVGEFRLALGCLWLAVLDARVDDVDVAILTEHIACLGLHHAALEDMVEASHLVPTAQKAVEVEFPHYRIVHRLPTALQPTKNASEKCCCLHLFLKINHKDNELTFNQDKLFGKSCTFAPKEKQKDCFLKVIHSSL